MIEQHLHWTHRKPVRAGWYWSKFLSPSYKDKAAITVMHITVTHNRYKANGTDLDDVCRYGTRLWAGPLTPPDTSDIQD